MDSSLDRIALPAGSLLFAESETGSCAFLVISGRVEIFITRDGRQVNLAERGPGEIVGEMAILDRGPRSASARAIEDCELVVIDGDQLAHRMAHTDPVLRMCLGVVITRYREMVAMISSGDRRRVSRPFGVAAEDFEATLLTLSLESELRRALRQREFELFFQPIVRLPSERLVGFEALLRWRHPARGLMSPLDFISIAEASGLIGDITTWCLNEVGRAFPRIMSAALSNIEAVEPLFMSVNISGHDLSRAAFVPSVAVMLEASGIAPGSLKLEVTESVLMKDPAKAVETLAACRRLGMSIAIVELFEHAADHDDQDRSRLCEFDDRAAGEPEDRQDDPQARR
jgi:CRP-like cAMP-binding protein